MKKLQAIDKRETKHLRTYYYYVASLIMLRHYYVVTTFLPICCLEKFLKFLERLHNLFVCSNVP